MERECDNQGERGSKRAREGKKIESWGKKGLKRAREGKKIENQRERR